MLGGTLAPEVLLDHLDLAIVVHGPDDRIVYANASAARLLGVGRDEMRVRTADHPWPVVDLEGAPLPADRRPVAVARRSRAPVQDFVLGVQIEGQGEPNWLRVHAVPLAVPSDHVLVTFLDVTAEVQKLSEVRREHLVSEQRYAAVLRAMSEGVAVHAEDGAIQFCNPAAEAILGLTRAQMLGREAIDPRWALVHPDGSPLEPSEIPSEITRHTGRPCRDVRLGVQRAEERAWLSVSTDPIGGEGDPSLGVVATFTDVTSEYEIRRELERTSARLVEVTTSFPGLILQMAVSPEGRVTVSFAAGRDLRAAGLLAAALTTPDALLSALVPEDRDRVRRALLDGRSSGASFEQTFRASGPDGARWVELTATPCQTSDGPGFTAVLLDVHEQHLLAERMELDQRRRAVGELAAGVAHNFNNLLAVIQPNLAEVRRHVATPHAEALADAEEATHRAVELVRQLLVVARGEPEAPVSEADLASVVREVGGLCQRSFDRSIEIQVSVPEGPAWVRSRPTQLHQLLLNLCINARDALRDRSPRRLTLTLERLGDRHRLVVADTGTGMTEATLARLGQPFFTTKGPTGTGLGVATALRTVEDAGGSVVIESELGVGTRFILSFPVGAGAVAAPEATPRPSARPLSLGLVVDDDPLVARAIGRLVEPLMAGVVTVGGGREAIALLERRHEEFAVVLLDLTMPEMSGVEVLAVLQCRWPTLPVVVVSGAVAGHAGLEHAAAVLEKPLDAAVLQDTLLSVARVAG